MKKGTHQTEEAKQKLREARKNQLHPHLATRGITRGQAEEATANGLRWCSGQCKAFVPRERFADGGSYPKCRACIAKSVQKIRDRKTPKEKQAASQYFREWRKANPEKIRSADLKNYGVTEEWYDAKFTEQGGCCAICLENPYGNRPDKFLCIDHDHKTGAARGILCNQCNMALGKLENPDLHGRKILSALWNVSARRYLKKYAHLY